MLSWPRLVLAYILAGLFCLGVWYYQPVPIPRVRVHAPTEADIKAEWALELQQKEIDKAIPVSAHLSREYGCPVELSAPTAVFATSNHLPVRVVTAVVIVESSCRPRVINPRSGATGLMQVMPKMHRASRKDLLDRETNLRVGTHLLAQLIHQYGLEEGVASYFGITPGSDAAYDYAYHVLEVAGYKRK